MFLKAARSRFRNFLPDECPQTGRICLRKVAAADTRRTGAPQRRRRSYDQPQWHSEPPRKGSRWSAMPIKDLPSRGALLVDPGVENDVDVCSCSHRFAVALKRHEGPEPRPFALATVGANAKRPMHTQQRNRLLASGDAPVGVAEPGALTVPLLDAVG